MPPQESPLIQLANPQVGDWLDRDFANFVVEPYGVEPIFANLPDSAPRWSIGRRG